MVVNKLKDLSLSSNTNFMYLQCLVPVGGGILITVGAMNLFEYQTVNQLIREKGRAGVVDEIRQRNEAIQQYHLGTRAFLYVVNRLTTPARSIALRERSPKTPT